MYHNLEVAQIFSDNMVLQRNIEIPIWGRAPVDSIVKVEFCSQTKITQSIKGKWTVMLSPIGVCGPFEMKVSCGIYEIVLKNIYVGEVWIAGGQSNMEYGLLQTKEGKDDIPTADFPEIRYYHVPRIPYENGHVDEPEKYAYHGGWQICTPHSVGNFSAVAFRFAVDLYKALNIPVGIISCNWGATSASCWMSEEYLIKDSETRIYLDEYYELIAKLDPECYENKVKIYENELQAWIERRKNVQFNPDDVDAYFRDESAGCYPWPPPMGPKNPHRPAGLYRAMLAEIIPYGIKGVIFYQGESDAHRPYLYRKLFSTMIQNWRDDWKNSQLPFLFVQLSSFDNGNSEGEEWPKVRESQLYVAENLPHTAMVVSIDCGDHRNIHPTSKSFVGERLALLARAIIYGQDIECSGPIYRKMKINQNKIILYFDHIGKGLEAKGEILKGFKVCGENKIFYDAIAEIKGDVVEVFCNEVQNPAAVRYGWTNYADVNLYNIDGFPASPFRTDIK